MKNQNKITAAISKIKNSDLIKHGEEILITVRQYAQEYIDAYKEISTSKQSYFTGGLPAKLSQKCRVFP